MRVLVTGDAGFIGSHLTDALLARGDDVTVVDDLSTGRLDRINPSANLRTQSVVESSTLATLIRDEEPEVVFHLAAQIDVRKSVADPAADAEVNVVGTINVLQAAQSVHAKVMFASTGGAIYGVDAPIPSSEQVLPEPEAPYGTAKYCAEQYIGLYNRLHGAKHCALRLGNVYGPRQDPTGEAGVVAIFCGLVAQQRTPTIFGDGTQTRDYVYVGDVVEAFLLAAESDRAGIWNVGTGTETSVLQLVGETAGRPVDPQFAQARPGELARSALDAG